MTVPMYSNLIFLQKNSRSHQAKRRKEVKNLSPRNRKACHSVLMYHRMYPRTVSIHGILAPILFFFRAKWKGCRPLHCFVRVHITFSDTEHTRAHLICLRRQKNNLCLGRIFIPVPPINAYVIYSGIVWPPLYRDFPGDHDMKRACEPTLRVFEETNNFTTSRHFILIAPNLLFANITQSWIMALR
jgi:hypothetical protein